MEALIGHIIDGILILGVGYHAFTRKKAEDRITEKGGEVLFDVGEQLAKENEARIVRLTTLVQGHIQSRQHGA